MKKTKFFLVFLIVSILVITQIASVAAASSFDEADFVTGTILEVTLATDPSTGITTVLVTLEDDAGQIQTVRISEATAYDLGLLDYDVDGKPFIVDPLPEEIEIPLADIIPDEEELQHPVGSALAVFFSDIPGIDYETIMEAHEAGNGFGVIAKALWLTQKLEGDSETLIAILDAKKSGDFSVFIILEDDTSPTNWGQFRKAVMNGDKKDNLGVVMSGRDKDDGNANHPGNNNGIENNKNTNKEKGKDKEKDPKNMGNPNKP